MKTVMFVVLPYSPDRELQTKHKLRSFVAHPYGVLSIATYLQRNTGVLVEVFDCNIHKNWPANLQSYVELVQPDIIGVSMMFDCSYGHLPEIVDICQGNRNSVANKTLVIGGAAATASYETILKENPAIDAVCYGEGELPFLNLVQTGTLDSPGWATRTKQPIREKVEDLDDVIDINYSFIDPEDYGMSESFSPFASQHSCNKQFFIVTSRGCPFDCAFCVNSANPDKSMRYASVDKIITHVEKLIGVYGMNVLTFYDDQILFNKKRAKELFRRLIRYNLRIECPNGLSVAFIDDELAGLMKSAGMDTVNLAIESGSPYVLNELIHKPLKVNQVQPVINILRKYGFWIQGYFVFGMPGETSEHRKETRDAVIGWGLDWMCITNACPTRGSRLYNECIEKGYIPKDMRIDDLDMNRFIINANTPPEQLVKESYRINLDVNFVNNHRMRVGEYEIAMRAFLDVIRRYPDHAFAYYNVWKCAAEIFFGKTKNNAEWARLSEELLDVVV